MGLESSLVWKKHQQEEKRYSQCNKQTRQVEVISWINFHFFTLLLEVQKHFTSENAFVTWESSLEYSEKCLQRDSCTLNWSLPLPVTCLLLSIFIFCHLYIIQQITALLIFVGSGCFMAQPLSSLAPYLMAAIDVLTSRVRMTEISRKIDRPNAPSDFFHMSGTGSCHKHLHFPLYF